MKTNNSAKHVTEKTTLTLMFSSHVSARWGQIWGEYIKGKL